LRTTSGGVAHWPGDMAVDWPDHGVRRHLGHRARRVHDRSSKLADLCKRIPSISQNPSIFLRRATSTGLSRQRRRRQVSWSGLWMISCLRRWEIRGGYSNSLCAGCGLNG